MAEPRDPFASHPDLVSLDAKDGGLFGTVADFMQRATPEQAREALRRVREVKSDKRGRGRGGSS